MRRVAEVIGGAFGLLLIIAVAWVWFLVLIPTAYGASYFYESEQVNGNVKTCYYRHAGTGKIISINKRAYEVCPRIITR